MCASYGLDPRFADKTHERRADAALMTLLAEWAQKNNGATIRLTGPVAKNMNPLFTPAGFELGWWQFLRDGQTIPHTYNTRSERMLQQPGYLKRRTLIPASWWYEYRKPDKTRFEIRLPEPVSFLAGITQQGRNREGELVTCYSMIMQPMRPDLAGIHDRMPVPLPADAAAAWLDPAVEGTADLMREALAASQWLAEGIIAREA